MAKKEKMKIVVGQEPSTTVLEEYKKTLDLLDAYDHNTQIRPEGTYYDGYESLEEAAAEILYMLVKESSKDKFHMQDAAIGFLKFLDLNNALFINEEKRISDTLLIALIMMIDKSREEEKETIINLVINCLL